MGPTRILFRPRKKFFNARMRADNFTAADLPS